MHGKIDLPIEQGGPRKTSTDSLIHMSMACPSACLLVHASSRVITLQSHDKCTSWSGVEALTATLLIPMS